MPQRISLGLLVTFLLVQCTLISFFIAGEQPDAWFLRIRKSRKARTPLAQTEFSWETLPARKDLEWRDCFPDRQCARLMVPLDHSEPRGKEATIALIRKPSLFAPDSPSYRGPILFNPGGPGGSGIELIQGLGGDCLSVVVGPQFDVVGFDPRGTGRSTPRASFFKTEVEREIWGAGSSVANHSAEGVARTWARARVLGGLAAMNDDGGLRYLNTEQTARDMLSIVHAHGESKLQYWGLSYGTVLGATFASLFPDKIGRMIIDGVVDADEYFGNKWSNNLSDAGKVLESFFTSCAAAGPAACAFWAPTPAEIQHNLTVLYAAVRVAPVPAFAGPAYGLLDYARLRSAVFEALYSPYAAFAPLAQGLSALAAGDAGPLFPPEAPFACECDAPPLQTWVPDAATAIFCNDNGRVPDDLRWAEEYFTMMAGASEFGDVWATGLIACQGWPRFPKTNFRGPFQGNTSHPILLIGNTADPVTPLWGAHKMATGFKDSVVLTQDSAGHCSLSAPSLCTSHHIRNYLLTGALPEPGITCNVTGSGPFPVETDLPLDSVLKEGGNNSKQKVLLMSAEDQELLAAATDLSKMQLTSYMSFSFA